MLIHSGDVDGIIPITSTRYAINSLKLPIEIPWRPWYIKEDDEVRFIIYKREIGY